MIKINYKKLYLAKKKILYNKITVKGAKLYNEIIVKEAPRSKIIDAKMQRNCKRNLKFKNNIHEITKGNCSKGSPKFKNNICEIMKENYNKKKKKKRS